MPSIAEDVFAEIHSAARACSGERRNGLDLESFMLFILPLTGEKELKNPK